MRAHPAKLVPSVHVSGATFCVPAKANGNVCTGRKVPSLLTQRYETEPAPFVVIVPLKVNVCGHVVLNDGVTNALMFVTANDGGNVGVKVEVATDC